MSKIDIRSDLKQAGLKVPVRKSKGLIISIENISELPKIIKYHVFNDGQIIMIAEDKTIISGESIDFEYK
jgi:hypothetical protein